MQTCFLQRDVFEVLQQIQSMILAKSVAVPVKQVVKSSVVITCEK